MIGMKILDRYILKKFLTIFLFTMVAFLAIFHVVDVIEKIDYFLKSQMTITQILIFYYYQLPYYIDLAIPMSLLLASVFTIGILIKHNELAAIKSSGISMYRITSPILILGFISVIGLFFFEDYVLIPSSRKKIEIEKRDMKRHRRNSKKLFSNITFQDSPHRNIVISKFRSTNNTAYNITIQETANNKLTQRIDAKKMTWNSENHSWKLTDFKIRNFNQAGDEISFKITQDSTFYFRLKPEDISNINIKPEEMRYSELKTFIKNLKESGNDPTRWEVNLYYKLAFPMTNFIVILFGLPLAALKHQKSISFGAGISLLIIFLYYGFVKFGQVLGFNGILSPGMGAWLGNIIFLSCGLILFLRIRQ